MVGEGVVFQGMRGYTVPPHAPAVACFTMSVTQHIWLKKKYYRVPIFNPVVSEATRLSVSVNILARLVSVGILARQEHAARSR